MRYQCWLALAGLCGVAACDSPVQPSTPTHTVGGVVSGLAGSGLVLVDNGSETLPVSANGPITFARALAEGENYRVTVRTQPASPAQTCVVSGGSGAVSTTDITTVIVACSTDLVFASVSAGDSHTCGVTTAGAAYCWGDNTEGELGDGTKAYSVVPVPVAGGLTFSAVSAGTYHTCGVTTAGVLYCWGTPYGWETPGHGTTPESPARGLSFASVSVGRYHVCGVTTAGAAYCWGGGVLGDGNSVGSPTPVPVAGGLTFAGVSVGAYSTCGVTTTGAAYCWGENVLGGLGTGSQTGPDQCPFACSTVPAAVTGGLRFRQVDAKVSAACGVTTGGDAYCWGSNVNDDLGFGTRIGTGSMPLGGGYSFPLQPRSPARPGLAQSGHAVGRGLIHLRPHLGRGRVLLGVEHWRSRRRHGAVRRAGRAHLSRH